MASAVSVDAGRADLPPSRPNTAAGADATTTPLVDGYFEISLPAAYFSADDSGVTLAWVDFFR
ncbi:MAG: hypothetical protein R2854_03120 [Caldilineaceae bacterium]